MKLQSAQYNTNTQPSFKIGLDVSKVNNLSPAATEACRIAVKNLAYVGGSSDVVILSSTPSEKVRAGLTSFGQTEKTLPDLINFDFSNPSKIYDQVIEIYNSLLRIN